MGLGLEVAGKLRGTAESTGDARRPCSFPPPLLVLCTSSSTWPPTLPGTQPGHPPSLRHSQGSTHLSHSWVGLGNLAQICLSTQKGGQLGLGQQVLQVVGSSNFQLGQGQADGPVEIMPLGVWGAPTH